MVNEPLVSVIVPTYGRPVCLERCLNSIFKQTYPNIEVIVVDDNDSNSSFRKLTEQVVEKYATYKNFKYVQHEKNRNGSAARNTGWKESKGEFITFVDDDDELCSDKIEKQVNCLLNLDDTWAGCYSGYEIIKPNLKKQHSSEKRQGDLYVAALMRTMFLGSGSNLFLRKKNVDLVNGYDESFYRNQDIEFLVRVLEFGKLAYIDDVLLTIHQEDKGRKNISLEENEKIALFYLKKMEDRIKRLPSGSRKLVVSVISLERFRFALCKRKFVKAACILFENRVSCSLVMKYVLYLFKRVVYKESYGFYG